MSADELYIPPSNFLVALGNGDVALTGSLFAEENLNQLIKLTSDANIANRDWATFFLAQAEIDTPQVREALLQASDDEDAEVRAEAILGLAMRDRQLALPFVQRELSADTVDQLIFEAAALVAHSSLVDRLSLFADKSDQLVTAALEACSSGVAKDEIEITTLKLQRPELREQDDQNEYGPTSKSSS